MPSAVGWKATATSHEARGASVVPQVRPAATDAGLMTKSASVVSIVPSVSGAVPVLFTVMICTALSVPIGCPLNSFTPGWTRMSGNGTACPVPLKATTFGLPLALLEMVKAPVRAPVTSGVKVTLMVHVASAASEAGHAVVNAKSPLVRIEAMASAPGPLLTRVTVWAGLAVSTVWGANDRVVGVTVAEGIPAIGVTAFDAADRGPVPTALVAATLKT